MAGRIPSSFTFFMAETEDQMMSLDDERGRDEEVESTGNESMKVHMNATASDVVSLDDNISVSQIDPGNFSESDIEDEDSCSNYCVSFTDVLGGFPESDLEESEEISECMSDAGISFNSDLSSPKHSSCRSYPVSEDRDDREETKVQTSSVDGTTDGKGISPRNTDYEHNEGELNTVLREDAPLMSHSRTRLRSATISKRKAVKTPTVSSSFHQKRSPNMGKKSDKTLKRNNTCSGGKRKALAVMTTMRLADDTVLPTLSESPIPKPTRSLSIPILDLCITEDEGYLGMAEETSDDSDKEKDENKLPANTSEF